MISLKPIFNIISKRLGLVLFLVFAMLGMFILTDYGMSWDEMQQRYIGSVSYEYVHGDDSLDLHNFRVRTYGVAIELPLIYLEKALELTDPRDIYLMRHATMHLLFLLSAWCFYLLVLRLYKSRSLAVIGFLAIVLHPRIYAHSFFNSKDVPFLALIIIALWLAAIAFERKKWWDFVFLGLVSGLVVNARILGLVLVTGIVGLLLLDLFFKSNRKQVARNLITFLLVTSLSLYISFPYLWIRPFTHFATVFEHMSKFPWGLDVLFMGKYILVTEEPWYYGLTWFGITTPIVLVGVGAVSFCALIYYFVKEPLQFFKSDSERNVLLHASIFAVTFVAIIALGSNIYDGWRQIYFVYPGFILIGMYGLHKLKRTKAWLPIITVMGLSICGTAIHMIHLHPHQQVYFNLLVRERGENVLRQKWEMDYWGASYRQGLKYILENDGRDTIRVAVETAPGKDNRLLFPQSDRKRLQYTEPQEADYFLTNYRWHPESYPEYEGKKWKEWEAYNSAYMTVFKLN